jgi:hypothetical protein
MNNKLLISEKFIEIQCDRSDMATRDLAMSIPFIHHNRIYTSFHTTVRNIDLVLKIFRNIGPFDTHRLPEPVLVIYDREMERRIETKTLLEQGPREHTTGWLFKHQQLGRELALANNKYGFFYDTRTGKTPMGLQIVVDDIEANPNHKWMILCPLILIENAWLPDAAKFFPQLKVLNLHNTSKPKRLELFKQDAQLYITNIESFINYEEQVRALNIHGCFVDESSTMKSHSAKISKALVDYSQDIKKWYLLSGTPAPNGEWEYYKQLQSIDFFGIPDSYSKFKVHFFNNISYNPQYEKLQVKPERKLELMRLVKEYSIYCDKEDVLTTPGRDFIIVDLEMPEELKDKYKTLKNDMLYEISDDTAITAMSAAAMLNKLNQVTSGFILDTKAKERNRIRREYKLDEPIEEESYFLSGYRFDALDNQLALIGNEQAIIWCNYHKEFDIIKERLGDRCVCVYGKTNITEKNLNLKLFKEGKVQYLVANPASADKGLTLTNAHYAIYFSLNYSYELWKQSIERIYGAVTSQPNRCTYYIFSAVGTCNKIIYNAVQNKGDISIEILNHLKAGV